MYTYKKSVTIWTLPGKFFLFFCTYITVVVFSVLSLSLKQLYEAGHKHSTPSIALTDVFGCRMSGNVEIYNVFVLF